jgi:peptidoglycan/LPS O-acetylase OafA/YrhL
MLYLKQTVESHFQVRKYLSRRIRRIYPLWITFFLIGIIESYLFGFGGWKDSILSLSEDHSFGVSAVLTILTTLTFSLFIFPGLWNTTLAGGWSIQSEVANYLIFLVFGRRTLKLIFTGMFLIAIVQLFLNQVLNNVDSSPLSAINRLNPGSSFFFFCTGVLVNQILENRTKLSSWIKGNAISLILYSLTFSLQCLIDPVFGKFLDAIKTLAVLGMFIFLISRLNRLQSAIAKIGKYSYFIYFSHFHILWMFYHLIRDGNGNLRLNLSNFPGIRASVFLVTYIFVLGLSVLLGSFSYKYFESRFLSEENLFRKGRHVDKS